MDPITIVVLVAVAASGFGAGLGVGQGHGAAKVAREQREAIEAVGASVQAVAAEVGRPLVLDAEIRETLARTPVQCRVDAGGDPMSAACLLASCWAYGQSSAQRPECREVEKAALVEVSRPSP
jgi:hypothetical protein